MSTFFRSCVFKHKTAFNTTETLNTIFGLKSAPKARYFSSTAFRNATATVVKGNKPITKATSQGSRLREILVKNKPVASEPRAVYQSYAATLAQRSSPILLYQAPPHTVYRICCYVTSGFCLAYAVYNMNEVWFKVRPDLASWVPYALGGVCIMMVGIGGYLFMGPARIIRTIHAVPQKVTTAPGAQPTLMLEVELRKMFPVPFLPARKLLVKPNELEMPRNFTPIGTRKSAAELQAERKAEEQRMKEFWEYENTHVMTRPFRHMKWGAIEFFDALRQAFTREGFWKVKVNSQQYKLDISKGWALDGGKALDRLVAIDKRLL